MRTVPILLVCLLILVGPVGDAYASKPLPPKLIYHHEKKTLTFSPLELHSENVTLEDPEVNVKKLGVKARILYDNNHKKVTFEPLDLVLEGTVIRQALETRLSPLNLHLKTQGIFDVRETKLNISPLLYHRQ